MIRDERLEKMHEYVNAHRYVSVDELIQKFQVSKATVRRDLDILNSNGLIRLSRGGAMGNQAAEKELHYNEKMMEHVKEKVRIGEFAVQMIKENATVFIDTGTTTHEMLPFLLKKKNIQVITNDLLISTKLAVNTDIDINVPGGRIRRGYYTLLGHVAEEYLKQVYVDIAFMSFDAIDLQFGCSIANTDEVAIKQTMIACSERTVALCDHSKYDRIVSWKVCPVRDIDLFVTGNEMTQETRKRYENGMEKITFV